MSIEFRQRTPGEYAQLLRRRTWLILLPTLAVASAVTWVVWRLPNIYESSTQLIVKPATISSGTQAGADINLSARLDGMTQQIISRTTLEPMMIKHGLYEKERKSGVPIETIIDGMRHHIKVEIDKADEAKDAPAFRITFQGREPQSTRNVAAELAGLFVSAQIKESVKNAAATRKFYEEQLDGAQKKLDAIEARRLQVMHENLDSLPTTVQPLIAQLSGLREEQKARIAEIGRLSDSVVAMNRQINDLKSVASDESMEQLKQASRPQNSQAYGELIKQKAKLEAELATMLTTLKPKNPDVVAKSTELEKITDELRRMEDDWKSQVDLAQKSQGNKVNIKVSAVEIEKQRAESELTRQREMLGQADAQIVLLESRINAVPGVDVQLQTIDQEYKTEKTLYDQTLQKKQEADRLAEIQGSQQGETIQVVDPATLPQQPVAPRRAALFLLGAGAGLAVGLFLALVVELPKLMTIQTVDDAAYYTNLPVLASVPELQTPRELRSQVRKRAGAAVAAVALTVASVPVLVLALSITHVFDKFVA